MPFGDPTSSPANGDVLVSVARLNSDVIMSLTIKANADSASPEEIDDAVQDLIDALAGSGDFEIQSANRSYQSSQEITISTN